MESYEPSNDLTEESSNDLTEESSNDLTEESSNDLTEESSNDLPSFTSKHKPNKDQLIESLLCLITQYSKVKSYQESQFISEEFLSLVDELLKEPIQFTLKISPKKKPIGKCT